MEISKYIACICEGTAERVIIDKLLDDNKLIFKRDDLIEGEPIRRISARKFEQRYLRKEYSEQITVLRILDSHNENLPISPAYVHKIKVVNVVTAPEIEMLIILNERRYEDFKKSKKKPSDYCKENLGMKKLKSLDFAKSYFINSDMIIRAIIEYKRISRIGKNEYSLADLLNV